MSILLLLIIFIDQCTGQGQLKQSSLMLTVLFLIIISLPSIDSMYFIDRSQVDQICSQNCSNETCEQFFTIQSLPFCSNAFLNISSHRMNFTNEEHCRQYLQQLIQLDDEARIASNLFANYIQAIDPGEEENPYAKSDSDCQVRLIDGLTRELMTNNDGRFFLFRKPIDVGPVLWRFRTFIVHIEYCLVKRSVMKWNVFVRPFDPVSVNHYLLDNRCSSAMVKSNQWYYFVQNNFFLIFSSNRGSSCEQWLCSTTSLFWYMSSIWWFITDSSFRLIFISISRHFVYSSIKLFRYWAINWYWFKWIDKFTVS